MEQVAPEVLISEEEIALRIDALGKAITEEFWGQELTIVCVLKGAFMFCSDLMKKINLPVKLDFVAISSYGEGTTSSGNARLELDLSASVKGHNVLIIEDIVDTGLTATFLKDLLESRGAKTVKMASLLYKPSRTRHKVGIDYLGFEIEDKFVIGYGLDYAGRYRELPYIGVLNAGN